MAPATRPGLRPRPRKHGRPICGICGQMITPTETWHVDHKTALADGGIDYPPNLQVVHAACNMRKNAARTNEIRRPRKVWPGALDL
jgi:HNH endonuclease